MKRQEIKIINKPLSKIDKPWNYISLSETLKTAAAAVSPNIQTIIFSRCNCHGWWCEEFSAPHHHVSHFPFRWEFRSSSRSRSFWFLVLWSLSAPERWWFFGWCSISTPFGVVEAAVGAPWPRLARFFLNVQGLCSVCVVILSESMEFQVDWSSLGSSFGCCLLFVWLWSTLTQICWRLPHLSLLSGVLFILLCFLFPFQVCWDLQVT
jgi:hypothetical protein